MGIRLIKTALNNNSTFYTPDMNIEVSVDAWEISQETLERMMDTFANAVMGYPVVVTINNKKGEVEE